MTENEGFVQFNDEEDEERKGKKKFDPGVEAFLDGAEVRARERRLPPGERAKLAKEKKKKADRKRKAKRVAFDIPHDLVKTINKIADKKRITRSAFVAWLLARALEDYGGSNEELEKLMRPYLEPSESGRYEWNLRFELGENDEEEK